MVLNKISQKLNFALLILTALFVLSACSPDDNRKPPPVVEPPVQPPVKPPVSPPTNPPVKPPVTEPPTVEPPKPLPPKVGRPVGINITAIHDYSATVPFVDVFRSSRPFQRQDPSLNLDAQGWVKSLNPGQVANTFMLWDIPDRYPSGAYTVLYDGKGKLAYGGSARRTSRVAGKEVVEVDASVNGIELRIIRTDAADPIRNIRVIMPGGICNKDAFVRVARAADCEGDYVAFVDNYKEQIFNPEFLSFLRPFRVFRFMDTMATNGSKLKRWDERHRYDDATWAGEQGAPIEIMVELANRLQADAWFTLPHLAEDGYAWELAKHLHSNLDPQLKAYVEYSNEVWNGQFPQFQYAIDQGVRLKLDANKWLAGQKFYAQRAIEIFKIFESVFDDDDRLVKVLASQAANAWFADKIMQVPGAREHTDALAIAPYFGGSYGHPDQAGLVDGASVDEMLKLLQDQAIPEAIGWVTKTAKVTKDAGVDLIAYEGGQHLAGIAGRQDNQNLNRLFDEVNRHPQMKQLYLSYFQQWEAAGGKLFTYYASPMKYSKWGRWGVAESLGQSRKSAPKFDAVLEIIENKLPIR